MVYNFDNVKEYLKFKVDDYKIIPDEPFEKHELTVKTVDLVFKDENYLSNFLYCLKRQHDFSIEHLVSPEPLRINDLKYNVALDSGLNVISTQSAENEKKFYEDLKNFHREGDKCFWGYVVDSDKLELRENNKSVVYDYVRDKNPDFDKMVVIQPEGSNYDETQIVYIQTDQKPLKSLEVSYIFTKSDQKLVYKISRKNNWIY